jgi:hypothetical protein
MELIKLPTDNFYIFTCFAGLSILIFFINLFVKKYTEINKMLDAANKEAIPHTVKLGYIEEEVENIKNEINLRTASFQQIFSLKYGDAEQQMKDYNIPEKVIEQNKSEEYITQFLKIGELFLALKKKHTDIKEVAELVGHKSGIVKEKISDLKKLAKLAVVMSIAGLLMIGIGLYQWHHKYQWYQDKMTKVNYEKALKEIK